MRDLFLNALRLNKNYILWNWFFFTLLPYIFPHFLLWVSFSFTACNIWENNKIASDYKYCMLHY